MRNFLKGAIIGIALVIPGLSGSIFAVVVGLYDRLIASVNGFRADVRGNLRFLAPIALGAVAGILLSTQAVLSVTARWPLASYGFFIGLVLGTAPFIRRKIAGRPWRWWYLALAAAGFLFIYGLAQFGGTQPENLIAIRTLSSWADAGTMAFAGVFAVALMAIPGISGSIMLMVIDQYGTVYHAVASLAPATGALLRGDAAAFGKALGSVALLGPFVLGAVVGFIAIAKMMAVLLRHFEAQVYVVVAGIVLAATVILLETGIFPYWPAQTWCGVVTLLVSGAAGIAATHWLDRP